MGCLNLKITYLGQCGFLLEIGETRIVTDPYFSNLADGTMPDGTPSPRKYPAPVATLAELKPDVVLISHAHEDHLDPLTLKPLIESGIECLICAPYPECGKLEEIGAKYIHRALVEKTIKVKDVFITPIPCAHTQPHVDDSGRFMELSYFIHGEGEKVFFAGDMSFFFGLIERLEDEKCDILLLPVNGRDDERTARGIIGNIDHIEAAHLAAMLNATYVPMHHDLYAHNGCSNEKIETAAIEAKAKLKMLKPGECWVTK